MDSRRNYLLVGTPPRRVWKSKGQTWFGVGFGVFVALVGLTQVGRTASKGGGTGLAVVLLVLGLGMAAVFFRIALITDERGIRVRNPFSSGVYGWDEIKGFRIGRRGLFSKVCIVDLIDGRSTYAFAIQVSNIRSAEQSKEQRMVESLNQLLPSSQAPSNA